MVRSAIKDPIREKQLFFNRAAILFLGVIGLIAVLVFRMVQLQIWEHEMYQTRSDQNRIQIQPLAPPRGLIFDRHGSIIAENRSLSSLALVTERSSDIAKTIRELSEIVGITPAEITEFELRLKRKRRPYEPIRIRDDLNEEEIAFLAVNRHRFKGVEIVTEQVRHYPFGDLLAHSIGSVRRITEDDLKQLDEVRYSATRFVGKLGVERFYERSLHGEAGYQQVETDAHGRIRQVLDIEPPIAGHNITLHLDNRLQIAASAALGQRRGAVVALDPRSGGILAMVSQPGYDPNLFITGMSGDEFGAISTSLYKPLFNRAINGQYAPGSTFKPVVGLGRSCEFGNHLG